MDWISRGWCPEPGDLVQCTESVWYKSVKQFTKGKLYRVDTVVKAKDKDRYTTVCVKEDDTGEGNGWCLHYFEPAPIAAQILFNHRSIYVNGTQAE